MSNLKKPIKFVCATPKTKQEFKETSQLSLYLDKSGYNPYASIVYENSEGLPKIYNHFLNDPKNKDSFLIFVHDDVLIEDLFLEEKLLIAFEKYNIVGLAGSKKCNIGSQMSAWHLMSDRNDWVGEVSHSKDKKSWTTVFGPTDSRALILDGLFLAVDVSKILETQTFFDESFKFHHYDISLCLRANQNKLKMGVAPIKVTHFGLGDSMMSEEWVKSSEIFKNLYK